jgi:flagellar basal body-associated protein FliL
MAEAEAQPSGGSGKKGIGALLVPLLLLLVLVGVVVVILTLRGMSKKTSEPAEAAAAAPAAPVKMFHIPVWEDQTTTNRLQQAVQCTVTLQIRENAKGTREKEWTSEENLRVLQSILVDVIQPIDFQSPRPPANEVFEAEVRRRVDTLMGEEGAVDRVLVTHWVVLGR